MRHKLAGRGLVVGSCLLALVGTACTPHDPPPPPPTASVATPSPTPTENAQEREQRVAYEAAEKSYREFSAEFRRVTGAGGAKRATQKMRETAAGPYLTNAVKVINAYNKTGGYTKGAAKFGYIRPAGYSSTSLVLDVCEDETSVRTFDSKRKQVATNGVLALRLDVRRYGDAWKIWDYSGKEVKSCDD